MIVSGVNGAIDVLAELSTHFGALFGPEFELTFEILVGILGGLTLLGGIGVVIGGLILATRRFEIGRILIILCVGMSVLGLVMSLIQIVMSGTFMMPLASQLTQSLGWIGAIFSIVARTIAEQPAIID